MFRLNSALDRDLTLVSDRLNYENRLFSLNNLIDKRLGALNDRLKSLVNRANQSNTDDNLNNLNQNFIRTITKLSSLNPLYILNRGYSITFDENEHVVNTASLKKGDVITTMLCDGRVKSEVIDIQKKEKDSQ